MIPEGYSLVADIAVGGVHWYECKGCGTVEHIGSASWHCDRCGADDIFGCHYCPKLHNHPLAYTGANTGAKSGLWLGDVRY